MTIEDDIAFLEDFRARILRFLVDGTAPSLDPVWGGKGIFQMDAAMKDPAFREQRQALNRMKGRAAEIVDRLGITCTFVQYPPPAAGGPMIRRPLFDLITDNRTPHTLDGSLFTDKIDEAIGRLQTAAGDLRAALPVLPVHDLAVALDFYESRLGFAIRQRGDAAALVERSGAGLLLRASEAPASRDTGDGWDAVLHATDPEALATELTGRGVTLRTPLGEAAGWRGFTVSDPDGNILYLGHPV